jgi:FkbM family methyltransferase
VEPSPPLVSKIRQNRPKSPVLQLAVGSKYGVAEFRGDKAVSGLIDNLNEDYIKRWGVDDFEKFKVITAPFNDIEAVMGFDYIDFLSVDIQGGEFDLLSTLDSSISVGVICIELEGQHIVKEEQCRLISRP